MADQKLLDYQSTKIRYLEYFSFLNCIFKVTFRVSRILVVVIVVPKTILFNLRWYIPNYLLGRTSGVL